MSDPLGDVPPVAGVFRGYTIYLPVVPGDSKSKHCTMSVWCNKFYDSRDLLSFFPLRWSTRNCQDPSNVLNV